MKRFTPLKSVLGRKTCSVCHRDFMPSQPMQRVCGVVCARRVPILARKAHREALRATKPLSYWHGLTEDDFNGWVRERDRDQPCISCGTTRAAWDAGHYRSVGAAPELRYEPLNVHKQCVQCNQSKAGNVLAYRAGLIPRIGLEKVEWLEGPHAPKHYDADALRAIANTYRQALKALRASDA